MARKKKIDKEMGFRLKKARTDQKLTYEELAEKSGVSSRYIKEIENHGNVPSVQGNLCVLNGLRDIFLTF